MTRKFAAGNCEHCRKVFPYYLIHSGFNNSWYAYCNRCGMTAILDYWNERRPQLETCPQHQAICEEMERYVKSCECGGRFRRGASPRCPGCYQELSAVEASRYIQNNAEGTPVGWTWQRNWTGRYCIVIGDRVVQNNFR